MGRKTITDLPRELVDEVIAYLSDDPDSLASCSLTHPSWTDAAQSHMFHTIFERMNKGTPELVRFFTENPRPASHVKVLDVFMAFEEWPLKSVMPILAQYTPALTHLYLPGRSYVKFSVGLDDCLAISDAFRRLARLRLRDLKVHPSHVANFLRTGVRELELCYSGGGPSTGDFLKPPQRDCWQKMEFYSCTDSSTAISHLGTRSDRELEILLKELTPHCRQTGEKLESVTISVCMAKAANSLIPVFPQFSSLRVFSLDVYNEGMDEWTPYYRAWLTHVLDCVFASPNLELVTLVAGFPFLSIPHIDRCYPWKQVIQILASQKARLGTRKPAIRIFVYRAQPDSEVAELVKKKFSALRDIEVTFSHDDYEEHLHQALSITALNQTRKENHDRID